MAHSTTIQGYIILYLAEVRQAFQLTLVEYNNFEAGEGTSKLETEFAHISHKIVRWVRVGNNLETRSQLGDLIGVCIFDLHSKPLKHPSYFQMFEICPTLSLFQGVTLPLPLITGCFKSSFRFFLRLNFTDY